MNYRHRKKRIQAWRLFLAFPRSVWFNFRFLPWSQARKLPILISNKTKIESMSGKVVFDTDDLRIGLVKIGFDVYEGTNWRHENTHLNIRGTFVIRGNCKIGAGSSVEVSEGARLTVGNEFNIGPRSLVICHKEMTFGDTVRFSWCCTVMDTDQHDLVDLQGNVVNPDRAIVFGNNVWIGCNAIITKGVQLASNTTVSAGTRLTGRYEEPFTVLSGNPATVVRRGVRRK
ncbi:MAG: hypothetical protein J6T37_04795 [Bacteroidales bacterium]|nr:hypothetical protein [Bacteroidales bacterium]